MKFAVLGTGMVGRTIAAKLVALGHEATIGTRDPQATLARRDNDPMGNPPFAGWQAANPKVKLATMGEAVSISALVVNAVNGAGSVAALEDAGESELRGKVLIDISVPLDFSKGFPPTVFVANTDSLGEQIQRRFPELRVVKTLNTVNANVMVEPKALAAGDHTMFVCGNDPAAKGEVSALLRSFGWSDVMDLGDITAARGTEMYIALWLRLYGTLKTPNFSIKVVR